MKQPSERNIQFWVVSPNVGNSERTVPAWKQATLNFRAAFTGYRPDDHGHKAIGYKFARKIKSNDIVLIARRNRKKPDLVGFGVVKGKFKKRLNGFSAPEGGWHGSLRLLRPFEAATKVPEEISRKTMMKVLGHQAALRRLHPERNPQHESVCDWMERSLRGRSGAIPHQASEPVIQDAQLVDHSRKSELEYQVRTKASTTSAIKKEEKLVRQYREWLAARNRNTKMMRRGQLCCDVYEPDRNNLIEAKASTKRECIRMAVGQLLDYAYLGKAIFGKPHMAILLPRRPDLESLEWLPNKIRIVWREGKGLVDNANKAFV